MDGWDGIGNGYGYGGLKCRAAYAASNYQNRRQWHLTVEEGYQLHIEWLDFELEDAWNQKCKFDYVALVDANGQVNLHGSSKLVLIAAVFKKNRLLLPIFCSH